MAAAQTNTQSWTAAIDGINIVVTAKAVKNLRLVVQSDGQVRATVPRRTSHRAAEVFLRQRIGWVRAQQARLQASGTNAPLADGGTVYLWGDALTVRARPGRSGARPSGNDLIITVADPADPAALAAAVAALYRREVKAVLPDIVAKWSAELGRQPSRLTLRTMRTRWGSCTPTTGAIRINPELAARHPHCLSYVVLHELAHLIEPGHGPVFQAIMDAHLPTWRTIRTELNNRH